MLLIFFSLFALAILVWAFRVEGMTEEDSEKVIELINKAQITEKQAIVAEVKHTEIK